jgi:hypothetical protein
MSKSSVNFVVDTIAFVAILFLASTGILVRFVLPAGSGHFMQLWGMDRHEWGQIHFWIAVALVVLLVLHIVLHWSWVIGMVKGRSGKRKGLRVGAAIVLFSVFLALASVPFLGKVEQAGEPPHKMQAAPAHERPSYQVNGSMTLEEIEAATGVPASAILKELGLPADVPTNERMGRLRRQYGFEMHDVQEIVRKHGEAR